LIEHWAWQGRRGMMPPNNSMVGLTAYFRRRRDKPYVRPWALATPVAVLLLCLPLLRPLRHPGQPSSDEALRLASTAAMVEHRQGLDPSLAARLAIDAEDPALRSHMIVVEKHYYADQPPMMTLLLSGPYWFLHRMGYRLRENSVLVPYLLTLLGVTLPAAAAGGLLNRMGRIFELKRPWRCGLAAATIFGSGMISYAVVLNPHVPAAALVLAAVGCLVHLAASPTPSREGGWLALAGFCAALAATIDPWATVFLVLLVVVIVAMRLRPALRVGGVILYLLGAAPPIALHGTLTVHLTGDLLPGSMHPELSATRLRHFPADALAADDATATPAATDSGEEEPASLWQTAWRGIGKFLWTLLGEHGLLSHFPVVVLGVAGMFAVMHRHWPATTKVLAAISAIAMLVALIGYTAGGGPAASAQFANRWLILFIPILLFWTGAWLRRSHRPAVWCAAAVLLAFSVIVSLIGATDPMPPGGYSRYTVAAALHNLFYPTSPTHTTALAD